jgi:hypothetical protein
MPRTLTLGAYSAWTAKTPKKTPIHRPTHRVWSLTRLGHHAPVKGEAAEAGEAAEEAGVAAGAKANMRKESGIAFSIRKTMTIVRIIVQTRKDLKPSSRRRGRKRRERAP